jgi:hypothetical protein
MGAKGNIIYYASELYIGLPIGNYPMIKIFFELAV